MIAALLSAILFAQLPGGVVTGVVRDASGNPVQGVRVALMTEPGVLTNMGSTEASGQFRLESVPPGRYYVLAGRVDAPTYYPGTPELGSARVVEVTAGATVADLNLGLLPQSLVQPGANAQGRVVNLALAGNNVLDLINNLRIRATPVPAAPFSFTFDRLAGARVFFTTEANLDLQTECVGCAFIIGRDFLARESAPPPSYSFAGPGVEFRLNLSARELEFTCRAARCALGNSSGGKTFNRAESGAIPASGVVLFHVVP